MNLQEISEYLKQENVLVFKDDILNDLSVQKNLAKHKGDEKIANYCWVLEKVYKIKKNFVNAFSLLSEKKYEKAWNLYEQIEIGLQGLSRHFDYEKNQYGLLFIATQTNFFQKLFPYQLFFSWETLIKKEKCSICGKEITSPRNACEHVVGNLYMGEECIREVCDMEILGFAIVHDPENKSNILKLEGREYDYTALEMLLEKIKSPYGLWKLEIIKDKREEFKNISLNSKCPCGSGKYYKNCCFNTSKEFDIRMRIDICEGKPYQETPIKQIEMWEKES
jgi:hypothetical protein